MHHFERGYRFGETDGPTRSDRRKRPGDSDFAGPFAVGEISRARDPGAGDSLAPVIGKSLEDLSTPAVLVDLDVLERNIGADGRPGSRGRGPPPAPRQDPQVPPHRPAPARRGGLGPLRGEGRGGGGVRGRRLRRPVRGLSGRRGGQGTAPPRPGGSSPHRRGRRQPRGRARPSRARSARPDRLSTCSSRWTSVTVASACRRSARSRSAAPSRASPACACAGSSPTPATATPRTRRPRSTRSRASRALRLAATASELRAAGLPIEEVSVGSTPTAARGHAGRRGDRVPPRATTSSTTPRRSRSAPAAPRTAPSRSWPRS